MQNRDTYDRLLNSLCSTIRNKIDVSVEKGASRTAVEQGFIERIHQVEYFAPDDRPLAELVAVKDVVQ